MPFAVKQWADSPDPRLPDFNLYGWDVGQLPPFRWLLETTNATGIWTIFNAGVLVEAELPALPEDTVFVNVDVLPDAITVLMSSKGTQLPVGPFGITKSVGVILREGGVDRWSGGNEQVYPTAIAVWNLPILAEDSPSVGTVPDPFKLTPVKWNATSP